MVTSYLQLNGLVPVDDIAGQDERLYVDNVHVPALRAYIQPTALEG